MQTRRQTQHKDYQLFVIQALLGDLVSDWWVTGSVYWLLC